MATHVMTIHGWIPARLNQLMGHRRKGASLKRRDRTRIANEQFFRPIPEALGRRRVTIEITFAKGDRSGDPDCYFKSVHDALKHAKLIKDDTTRWVELAHPVYLRGPKRKTVIYLEDVPCPPSPPRRRPRSSSQAGSYSTDTKPLPGFRADSPPGPKPKRGPRRSATASASSSASPAPTISPSLDPSEKKQP